MAAAADGSLSLLRPAVRQHSHQLIKQSEKDTAFSRSVQRHLCLRYKWTKEGEKLNF